MGIVHTAIGRNAAVVHTAEIDSPVGPLRLASTSQGLAWVGLPHSSGRGLEGWLRLHARGARRVEAFAPNRVAAKQLLEYLEGKRRRFDLRLDLRGTPFQLAVYRAMLEIPYGETRRYGELARSIGREKAMRAVGAASGANPVALVVPCHRVIGSGGRLTGYGGGLDLKARLLAMERSAPSQARLL